MFPSLFRRCLALALGVPALFVPPAAAQVAAPPAAAASSLVAGAKSHLFGEQYDPHAPAAAPADVRPEWAGLIGEYGSDLARFYVLEDDGELKILAGWFDLETLHPAAADVFKLPASGPHGAQTVRFQRDAAHAVTGAQMGGVVYTKRPFDAPDEFFHITPLKPVAERGIAGDDK